ncbi:MAG TPA: hypothetical protein VFB42_01140 [Gaiellaceae bacterium]|nr:hypothetical protein [Gaiellaceae bacterium]
MAGRRPAAALLAAAVLLVGGATSAPALRAAHGAVRARFACYPAQFGPFRAQPVTVSDEFSRLAVSVAGPESVCAPAPGSSTAYLTCYTALAGTAAGAPRTVRAADEFSRLAVTVSRLAALCLPSARVDAGGSGVPARGLDSFSCYGAAASAGTRGDVPVGDAFASSRDTIGSPSRFCAPATWVGSRVRGVQPSDRSRFLTCYADRSSAKGTIVVLHNGFGYLKAALGARTSLCTTAALGP